jgi:hypothetical protein
VAFVIFHCITIPFIPFYGLLHMVVARSLQSELLVSWLLLDSLKGLLMAVVIPITPIILWGPVGAIIYTVRGL